MKKSRATCAIFFTTALVAIGSLYSADGLADSSNTVGQPRIPLGAMGLSQAEGLDTLLELSDPGKNAYWRSYSNNHEHHYGRNGYGSYEKNRYRRHRPDGNYSLRKPRPSDFETEEFKRSNATAQVKAQHAYAQGADGGSVSVGVIDEEFDIDHVDLEPNITAFEDLTEEKRKARPEADEAERAVVELVDEFLNVDHGTAVTGVIAAARNGEGIHGIAPEASILAIRADSISVEELITDTFDSATAEELEELISAVEQEEATLFTAEGDQVALLVPDEGEEEEASTDFRAKIELTLERAKAGEIRLFEGNSGFVDEDNARAIDFAINSGVDIINLSQGGASEPESEGDEAIIRANEAGIIVVAGAGNSAGPNPLSPAILAADPRTRGLTLAVGAVDAENNIADFSERCGTAKDFCLVAPGVQVLSTAEGDKYERNDGTSLSAPAVSGGLALLMDLFPTLYPEEAVQLVLRTADDLGEEGVDDVFGHGALNLERAVKPVGVARLPTGKNIRGKVVFLSRSKLGLSGAFGNAFAKAGAFKNGFFLDEFRRPFKADLSQQVVAQDRGINFEGVLGGSDVETETFVNPDGYQVTLSLRDGGQDAAFETPLAAFGSAQDAYDRENQLQSLRLSGELAPGLEVSSGVNLTAGQQLTADPASEATKGLFLFEGDAVNPQHGFLGRGNGLSLTQDLTKGTSLTLGFLTAGEQLGDRGGEGTTTQADLNHRFDNGAALGFSASFTQESEGFLGSEASGAFAARSETTSQFYTLSGSLPVTAGIEAFGSTTLGISDLSGVEGGLLSDLDRATSSAFAMGVVKKGVIDDQDRIGISFSQPLRIEGGADATLSVPTSVNADGTINETSETVNLQPSGRELNLQLAYTRKLAETVNVTNYALARSEPGHNAEAKPDIGVGVRVNWNF